MPARGIPVDDVLKPREFGYALCLHRARGQFDEHELFEAGPECCRPTWRRSGWVGAVLTGGDVAEDRLLAS
jgi:hypothetical protein